MLGGGLYEKGLKHKKEKQSHDRQPKKTKKKEDKNKAILFQFEHIALDTDLIQSSDLH